MPAAYLNRGSSKFSKLDYDKAIEDFDQAIKLDPEYGNAKLYLATAYSY